MLLSESMKSINFLTETFKELRFALLDTGEAPLISCFVCWIEDPQVLQERWSHVTSIIAVDYQGQLTDEFSIWNIYLVFVCPQNVNDILRYRIENDKFSMRKLVVTGSKFHDKNALLQYLNNEILGHDLALHTPSPESSNCLESTTSKLRALINDLGEVPLGISEKNSSIRYEQIKTLIREMQANEDQQS